MKRNLIFCFYLLSALVARYACAQNPLVKQWDARFGGTATDYLFSFQQTTDGGYILGGTSYSGAGGDRTQPSWGGPDCWIVKLSGSGAKEWDKRYGGDDYDYLYAVQQTADGGYILGGTSYSGISGDKTQPAWGSNTDYWIVKVDSLGAKQWDKRYGGLDLDWLNTIRQTRDGGYILAGYSASDATGDKTQPVKGGDDFWIIKVDSLGTMQWDKDFGGANSDAATSVLQTADGGYLIGGTSYSGIAGDKTQPGYGGPDYWIVKIDSLGNKQWDKDFGGINNDRFSTLRPTNDGGFILGGVSNSSISGNKTQPTKGGQDFWIIKIDSSGTKMWEKDFGGVNDEDEFGTVFQTADKGYLLSGATYSPLSGDKSENNLGPEQTWVVKTDSLGNKVWDKTLFTAGHDEMGYSIQTTDGCYAFANWSNGGIGGYKTQPDWDPTAFPNTTYDYWIVKFCDTTTTALPHADFTSSDSSFCSEPTTCIDFYDHSTGSPVSWEWHFTGGSPDTSTLQNPVHICYGNPGTYPVMLIVTNATSRDTLTVSPMITVGGTPPPPTITIVGNILYSSHAAGYQWYFNGNPIPGATDSFYVFTQQGTYSVRITDSNGCSSISNGVITSMDDIGADAWVTIYPNPAGNWFEVRGLKFEVGAKLMIYNMLGNKVYGVESGQLQPSTLKPETINVSVLSNGIYFLKIESGDRTINKKFVVLH